MQMTPMHLANRWGPKRQKAGTVQVLEKRMVHWTVDETHHIEAIAVDLHWIATRRLFVVHYRVLQGPIECVYDQLLGHRCKRLDEGWIPHASIMYHSTLASVEAIPCTTQRIPLSCPQSERYKYHAVSQSWYRNIQRHISIRMSLGCLWRRNTDNKLHWHM